MQLVTPLDFGDCVRSISLATKGTNIESGLDGYASGWGLTGPHDTVLPIHLKSVVLPSISLEDCKEYYGGNLTDRMFCAGYAEGGKDTCDVSKVEYLYYTNSATDAFQTIMLKIRIRKNTYLIYYW